MNHIAILNPKLGFLLKIILNKKTIESRWYLHKTAPWNKIYKNDVIYFKDSGKSITVSAKVDNVLQFDNLNKEEIKKLIKKYGKDIGIDKQKEKEFYNRIKDKNYCILIFLKNTKVLLDPFNIDKSGFGNACAWLCVKDLNKIKMDK